MGSVIPMKEKKNRKQCKKEEINNNSKGSNGRRERNRFNFCCDLEILVRE